jgi:head-tail adaptor
MLTQTRIVWRGRFFAVLGVMDKTEQRVFLTVRLREINA